MTATKLDFIVMAGCGMAVVVGQASLKEFADFPVDFGNIGALGVLAFYMWWNTTRTIPALVKDFRDDGKAARDDFKATLAQQEDRHRDQLALFRERAE